MKTQIIPDDIGTDPTSAIETITPELALDWLTANVHNRPKKLAQIERLKADMLSGRFAVNGETLKFSRSGQLLDGQNRLHACWESGETIRSLVVRGLPDGTVIHRTIDSGVHRSLKDSLAIERYPSATTFGAMVAMLWRYEKRENHDPRGVPIMPTVEQAMEVITRHPAIEVFVRPAEAVRKACGIQVSVGGTLMYLTSRIEDAEYDHQVFWDGLRSGVGLSPDDNTNPILLLRDAMVATGRGRKSVNDWVMAYALVAKAWNMFREGIRMKHLVWRQGGATPEPFPVPR